MQGRIDRGATLIILLVKDHLTQLTPAKTAGDNPAAPKTQFPLPIVPVLTSHELSSTKGVTYFIFIFAFLNLLVNYYMHLATGLQASLSDEVIYCQQDKH
jgi:hypothetical protein